MRYHSLFLLSVFLPLIVLFLVQHNLDDRFEGYIPEQGPFAHCSFVIDTTTCPLAFKMFDESYYDANHQVSGFKYDGISQFGDCADNYLTKISHSGSSNQLYSVGVGTSIPLASLI